MSSFKLTFEHPWLLLLALPAFAIILIPFLRLPKKRRKTIKRTLPVVLHLIVVLLLSLVLSGFMGVRTSNEQAVMLLVDLSDSTKKVQSDIIDHTEQLLDLIDAHTPVGVIAFAEEQLYSVDLNSRRRNFTLSSIEAGATDIDAALEYAASLLPSDKVGHLIVLSDGKETDGDADSTAHYLATQGVRIDAVYFDTTELSSAETQISSFTAPDGAFVDDELSFTVDVTTNTAGSVTLKLYDNNTPLVMKTVAVKEGSNIIELEATATSAGIHAYRVALETTADTLTQNNEAYAYLKVAGKHTVLVISDTVENASALSAALSADNDVTVVTPQSAPATIVELCNYDEIILSNVNYTDLPIGYDALLDSYVSVYGRSLLAAGGTNTFMYGSMKGTALENLLPVNFTLRETSDENAVALMLVLDCSTSMSLNPTYLTVAKQGAIKCVEAMNDCDSVGVVSFNKNAILQSELIRATDANKATLTRIISGLTTYQRTYYTEAIQLAHTQLKNSPAPTKHIIFLSDGQPSDHGYSEAVQAAASDGITVSTIGLGYASTILESMAVSGNGQYYFVENANDLPNIMLNEAERVTVDSLIEGDFRPIIAKKSDLTASVDGKKLPTLGGYLGTMLKEDATAYLTTEEGHPIYASWNYGLGKAACFTSDLNGRWSSKWLADSVGKTITANMVSTTIPEIHHDSSLSTEITVRGKTTNIAVTTSGISTENTVSLTATFANETKTYVLTQTDPCVYEATLTTDEPGIYELVITEWDSASSPVDQLETAVAVSYSGEYNAFAKDGASLLANLCSYSEGQIFVDMQELANVRVAMINFIYNPMIPFAIIALVLMLADIAIRKIRWKDIRNYFIRAKARKTRQ